MKQSKSPFELEASVLTHNRALNECRVESPHHKQKEVR